MQSSGAPGRAEEAQTLKTGASVSNGQSSILRVAFRARKVITAPARCLPILRGMPRLGLCKALNTIRPHDTCPRRYAMKELQKSCEPNASASLQVNRKQNRCYPLDSNHVNRKSGRHGLIAQSRSDPTSSTYLQSKTWAVHDRPNETPLANALPRGVHARTSVTLGVEGRICHIHSQTFPYLTSG